jgi:hypothetical protein
VLSSDRVLFFDAFTPVTDHFQRHPEAEACYLMYKTISWLFYVGTGLLESNRVSVLILISVVLIGCLPTPVMLTLRTWAVWNRNRRLSIGLPIFFVLCWAPMIPSFVMTIQSFACRHISTHPP